MNFTDFVTFKFNDYYKLFLLAEKGPFYPFKERAEVYTARTPLHSCVHVIFDIYVQLFMSW